ncbi:hypothetical protein ES703_97177 [subsurface metagenome]
MVYLKFKPCSESIIRIIGLSDIELKDQSIVLSNRLLIYDLKNKAIGIKTIYKINIIMLGTILTVPSRNCLIISLL